jgi:hypothetical protein
MHGGKGYLTHASLTIMKKQSIDMKEEGTWR